MKCRSQMASFKVQAGVEMARTALMAASRLRTGRLNYQMPPNYVQSLKSVQPFTGTGAAGSCLHLLAC